MKKLITILTTVLLLNSCINKREPIKKEPTHYYLVEVKYTDNSTDTFEFNGKYSKFFMRTEHADFSSGKIVCFYAYWDKVACDVKRFKILKDSIFWKK